MKCDLILLANGKGAVIRVNKWRETGLALVPNRVKVRLIDRFVVKKLKIINKTRNVFLDSYLQLIIN